MIKIKPPANPPLQRTLRAAELNRYGKLIKIEKYPMSDFENQEKGRLDNWLKRYIPIIITCIWIGSCTTGVMIYSDTPSGGRVFIKIGVVMYFVLIIYLPSAMVVFWNTKVDKTNYLGGWLCLVFVGILSSMTVPGYLAYMEQQRFREATSVVEHFRTALEDYADKHPDHRYPEVIPDYATLRTIINKHGGSLPEKQSEAAIAQIYYILDYGKEYNLTIEVDVVRSEKFLLITPEGVTSHSKIVTSSKGYKAQEIAQDNRFIINNKMVADTKT
ncbi:hypothetical protein QUF75_14575 [Desulfococcaceae bacterium HSG7]|nr:hypothetical protein [Desulfococcaceae bacterium HSG7]